MPSIFRHLINGPVPFFGVELHSGLRMLEAVLMSYEKSAPAPRTEPLEIESGQVALIDHFLLSTGQFSSEVKEQNADLALKKFGGAVVDIGNGSYQVERFPRESTITVIEEGFELGYALEQVSKNRQDFELVGSLMVDTRCLVIVDQKVVSSEEQLSAYQEKRKAEGDKAGRDYLRSIGGAVRYGFNRYGDELGVFHNKKNNILALWPDVVEETEEDSLEKTPEQTS